MSIKVLIPTPLRSFVDGASAVDVDGTTVGAVLESLAVRHPALASRLFDGDRRLRRFLNLYLNDEDVRFLEELNTTVHDGDELAIIPAVAGG